MTQSRHPVSTARQTHNRRAHAPESRGSDEVCGCHFHPQHLDRAWYRVGGCVVQGRPRRTAGTRECVRLCGKRS